MDCPILYVRWVNYLKKKNLYGSWIKDVSTYLESCSDPSILYEPIRDVGGGWWFNFNPRITYEEVSLKSCFLSSKKSIEKIISTFSFGKDSAMVLMNLLSSTKSRFSYRYKFSKVSWPRRFEEYIESTSPTLSLGLSRKLTRAMNKERSYRYKEKVEQPWYSKSYEKYNRKAWRK